MNKQQTTTTLAALRLIQSMIEDCGIETVAARFPHFNEEAPLAPDQIDDLCEAINTGGIEGDVATQDWRIGEGAGNDMEPEDSRAYVMDYELGSQSYLSFKDRKGECVLSLIIEVNLGVPALYISGSEDEGLLHVHAAHGGLVLAPDADDGQIEQQGPDRFSYYAPNALLIR